MSRFLIPVIAVLALGAGLFIIFSKFGEERRDGNIKKTGNVKVERPPLPDPPTPRAVLTRMSDIYSECESYKDSGVTTYQIESQPPFSSVYEFGTIYKKTDKLLFYLRRPNTTIPILELWRAESGSMECNTTGAHLIYHEIHVPFDAAAERSGKASTLVAGLFYDDVRGGNIIKLTDSMGDLRLLPDASANGIDCYVIEGTLDGAHYIITIGKGDFLLRKVKYKEPNRSGEVTFRPFINIPIDDADFNHSDSLKILLKK